MCIGTTPDARLDSLAANVCKKRDIRVHRHSLQELLNETLHDFAHFQKKNSIYVFNQHITNQPTSRTSRMHTFVSNRVNRGRSLRKVSGRSRRNGRKARGRGSRRRGVQKRLSSNDLPCTMSRTNPPLIRTRWCSFFL